jgi:hypothetical protein
LFKVFGHPARVAILQYIINQKSCICNDLVDKLGLASDNLAAFKRVEIYGYYTGTIDGKSVCYCIEEKKWKEIQEYFNQFFEQEVKVNQCC